MFSHVPTHLVSARRAGLAALLVAAGFSGAAGAAPAATAAPAPLPPGITGRIWQDDNRNGIQEVGEPGLLDVRMTAIWHSPAAPTVTTRFTTTTGADGVYWFTNVPKGDYTVQAGPFDWETHRFSPLGAGGDEARDSDFRQLPCPPATEGKDIIGEAETTLSGGTSDLDGGVYKVL